MLLKEKVALITGAASGIGRATAKLFAQQGAKVVLVDIKEEEGEQAAGDIRNSGGDALFLRADVGRMEDVSNVVNATYERYGKLDILHSNAAAYRMGSASEISEQDWDRTLNTCLKATWMFAHEALPRMVRAGGGAVVITGSVHAVRGYANYTAYQAAKGGLLSLTRSLAADYAPTVRVNTVLPGAVVTGLWDNVSEPDRQKIANMCPLRRNGEPEDIAQAVLFLASDMSAYITGTSLVVDGGLSSIVDTSSISL